MDYYIGEFLDSCKEATNKQTYDTVTGKRHEEYTLTKQEFEFGDMHVSFELVDDEVFTTITDTEDRNDITLKEKDTMALKKVLNNTKFIFNQ